MIIRIGLEQADWEEVLKVLVEAAESESKSKGGFVPNSSMGVGKTSLKRAVETIRRLLQEQTATLEKPE